MHCYVSSQDGTQQMPTQKKRFTSHGPKGTLEYSQYVNCKTFTFHASGSSFQHLFIILVKSKHCMVKSNLFRAIWMLAFCKERVFFSSACVELVSDQKPPVKLLCGILHQCVSTVLSVELQQKLKPSNQVITITATKISNLCH